MDRSARKVLVRQGLFYGAGMALWLGWLYPGELQPSQVVDVVVGLGVAAVVCWRITAGFDRLQEALRERAGSQA